MNCFFIYFFQVGKKGSDKGCFSLISSLCIGQNTIIVADARIQIFSSKGDLLDEIVGEPKSSKGILVGIRRYKLVRLAIVAVLSYTLLLN